MSTVKVVREPTEVEFRRSREYCEAAAAAVRPSVRPFVRRPPGEGGGKRCCRAATLLPATLRVLLAAAANMKLYIVAPFCC